MKSDGVVFLDATLAKPQNDHITSCQFIDLGVSDWSSDESDDSKCEHMPSKRNPVVSGAKCAILGHSEAEWRRSCLIFRQHDYRAILEELDAEVPKGKTWNLDADRQESSERVLRDLAASVPPSSNTTSATILRTLR